MIRSRIAVASVASMLVLALPACKKPAPQQTRTAAATGPSLLTSAGLETGMAALRGHIGEHAKLLQLLVFADHLVVQAQDAKDPKKVLQYEYRAGKVGTPVPVSLEGTGSLDDNLYSLDDVKLDVIPDLAKRAVEKLDAKNGKVSYLILKRNLPFEMDVQYRVFVKSPIKDGYVDADKNGKLVGD